MLQSPEGRSPARTRPVRTSPGLHPRARFLLLVVTTMAGGALLPAVATAAAPVPQSATVCGGSLTKDPSPTVDDPQLIDYRFHCDTPISAYTLIAERRPSDQGNIDYFSPSADVLAPYGGTVVATEGWTCEGTLPSNGFNCNPGLAGAVMSAYNYASGTLDLTDPYCKALPVGAKPGTPAEPQAIVDVIVTDSTGAQDGPFRLNLTGGCPKVPDTVPYPKPKPKPKAKPRAKKRARVSVRRARG